MSESKIVKLARKGSSLAPDKTFYVFQKGREKVFSCNPDDVPLWITLGYQIIHVFVNGNEIFE